MTVNVLQVGPGKLTFGASTALTVFSSQVTKISVRPSVKKGDPIPVLSGETAPGDRSEAFVVAGTFLQDFGSTKSLSEWTWANAGKTMPFEFVPDNTKSKAIKGECIIEYTEIGGEVGGKATADFEFECTSKPTIGNAG